MKQQILFAALIAGALFAEGGSNMPMLKWAGKDKVVNHHNEVPFRVLERKWGHGAASSPENMIIHGDNLAALKSLLPRYEGKVKCIYIDPPYNTGNEGWVYNDNVNDPQIKKWLGEVVGKEGEDFSRHDKWLCMMYPRLRLLQKLLAEDGIIFISIDDTESAHLRLICDEIFGSNNFLANIAWEKVCVLFDFHSRLFSGHAGNVEISGLSETMGGEINAGLPPNDGTPIAPEAAFGLPLPVAPHGALENVSPDNEQAVQVIGVQELPGLLAPLLVSVRADQLINIEIRAYRYQYLSSRHSIRTCVRRLRCGRRGSCMRSDPSQANQPSP